MDRKLLIERIHKLGFDPKHYFVTSDSAMLLHNIPRKAGGDVGKVHLEVSDTLFEKLKEKHPSLPTAYRMPRTLLIAPDVFVSTKYWDNFHNGVQIVDTVPVLRLGKLLNYTDVVDGQKDTSDAKAIEAAVARTLVDCKSTGKSNRQIGDHLGISDVNVPLTAKRLLGVSTVQWNCLGSLNPDFIDAEFDKIRNWDKVGRKLLPGAKTPKVMVSRIMNASEGRKNPELLSAHTVRNKEGKAIQIQQEGYKIKERKGYN